MNMVVITGCDAKSCAHNQAGKCSAQSVTVGGRGAPRCNMFCLESGEAGDTEKGGQVGVCKMSDCKYNQELKCGAPSMRFNWQNGSALCMTCQLKK